MEEVNGNLNVNVMNNFRDVNSVLYRVTNIYVKAGILQKNVMNIFCSKNLVLFKVNSIHSIRKSTKLEISKQQDGKLQKIQGCTGLKQVKRQRNRLDK